jgi:Zn-dependent peptidase ImmA (M78 family)
MSLKQTLINAERKAEELLKSLNIRTAPVLVEEIAKNHLNINVEYIEFGNESDLSGVLYRENNNEEVVIGVNSSHPKSRQRFTIAHEIGHYILNHKGTTFVDTTFKVNFRDATSSEAINLDEMGANAFAAALLMPKDIVFSVIQERLDGELNLVEDGDHEADILKEIADHLKVSQQALTIRLGKLGYI